MARYKRLHDGSRVQFTEHEELERDAEELAETERRERQRKLFYKVKRRREYWSIEDQLDSVFKTFRYLKSIGFDIGPDGRKWVEHIESVKNKHKKQEA